VQTEGLVELLVRPDGPLKAHTRGALDQEAA
jgi:hypothetical protein